MCRVCGLCLNKFLKNIKDFLGITELAPQSTTSSPNAASTFSVVMTNHKIPTEMSKSPLVRGNIKSPPIENHWKRVMPEDTTEQPHWRLASQVALVVKNLPANAGDTTDTDSIPGSGKEWQPTPVFLPGESHGQKEEPGRLQSMG